MSNSKHEDFDEDLFRPGGNNTESRHKLSLILTSYMEAHKVLLSYVGDVFGFRKGVVVAVDQHRIAWSLVNRRDDVEAFRLRADQIPVLKVQIDAGVSFKNISRHPAYRKWSASGQIVFVPQFDKSIGVLKALDRALISGETGHRGAGSLQWLPHDAELREAIQKMKVRAARYYTEEPE